MTSVGTPGGSDEPRRPGEVLEPRARVTVTLDGTPNKSFDVQFFSSPLPDPSDLGKGQTFLGAQSVSTDFTRTTPVSAGRFFVTSTEPRRRDGNRASWVEENEIHRSRDLLVQIRP